MNHYLAAVLLMIVAIGFPMLCAAMGMKVNTRHGWWDWGPCPPPLSALQ